MTLEALKKHIGPCLAAMKSFYNITDPVNNITGHENGKFKNYQ